MRANSSANTASVRHCPECGASWADERTCQDDFYRMLFWEAADPQLGEVHHLMVLCYHLQHPSLWSPEGLANALRLLSDFVVDDTPPEEARRRGRVPLDSGRRDFKIKATSTSKGSYPSPIAWEMTARDVLRGGEGGYIENIKAWANTIHSALREAGLYSGS